MLDGCFTLKEHLVKAKIDFLPFVKIDVGLCKFVLVLRTDGHLLMERMFTERSNRNATGTQTAYMKVGEHSLEKKYYGSRASSRQAESERNRSS